MSKILFVILGVLFASIIGILCFFICILANNKNDIWELIKFKEESKNE